MRGFVVRLAITALGLLAADAVVGGFRIDGAANVVIAALLLGIVNALVRPLLVLLTLPLTLITLGAFLLVVNGLSLAIVALTVLKVFLFDMSALTGLLRAVSFLGLGVSLIGLGYFYQRYVFPQRRYTAEESSSKPPDA